METTDLSKDPFFKKNHLGSFDCRLCLTVHPNEGNYLAHTQGKKHQSYLLRRKAFEAQRNPAAALALQTSDSLAKDNAKRLIQPKSIKIGRPAYQVSDGKNKK
jgi:splicing factor 3A subunit 2